VLERVLRTSKYAPKFNKKLIKPPRDLVNKATTYKLSLNDINVGILSNSLYQEVFHKSDISFYDKKKISQIFEGKYMTWLDRISAKFNVWTKMEGLNPFELPDEDELLEY
jgi:hypothetical protein